MRCRARASDGHSDAAGNDPNTPPKPSVGAPPDASVRVVGNDPNTPPKPSVDAPQAAAWR
jgi:hypothetical protein